MGVQRSYDEFYMQTCLTLATKGWGMTLTNPLVGAIVVKNNRIIGQGYHRKLGEAHAEAIALIDAGSRASAATLYVNLEPCCCAGRTPPCVNKIIDAGIKRVVIGTLDPNPRVNGKGIACLQKYGIEVSIDVLSDHARTLNRAYCTFITKNRPYVIMKIAVSRNGKLSGYRGKYITSEHSLRYVHSLRGQASGVLVGIHTVKNDDPLLTDRLVGRRDPARIILDPNLETPLHAHVLDKPARRIIVTRSTDTVKVRTIEKTGTEILFYVGNLYPLPDLLHRLGEMEIGTLLVEGGAMVFNEFYKLGLYDEIYLFMAKNEVENGIALTEDILTSIVSQQEDPEISGEDTLYHVYRNH